MGWRCAGAVTLERLPPRVFVWGATARVLCSFVPILTLARTFFVILSGGENAPSLPLFVALMLLIGLFFFLERRPPLLGPHYWLLASPPHAGMRKVWMLWSCVMHIKGCLPPLFILSLTATSLSASCQ